MLAQRAVLSTRRLPRHGGINRYSRRLNGSQQGPHQVYFQQPPTQPNVKPKLRWRIFRGTLIAVMSATVGLLYGSSIMQRHLTDMANPDISPEERVHYEKALDGIFHDEETAANLLRLGVVWNVSDKAISHTCRLPANIPCEDQHLSASLPTQDEADMSWSMWGVFDGHAGARTSSLLQVFLPDVIGARLKLAGALDTAHALTSDEINRLIADSFEELDHQMMSTTQEVVLSPGDRSRAAAITVASMADQGSCALLAMYDPISKALRVANTGDSRAILGRWDDEQRRYVALPMSVDHTGFNEAEAKRLEAEHPGESVIDRSTGRLFGLAVTRAFGDCRWKLPEQTITSLHERLWTNPPRPDGVVKTPPYLTARPDVQEIKVQTGLKPDFLILATDGLWDQLSSEQAVELVQMWLDKYTPKDVVLADQKLRGRIVKSRMSANGVISTLGQQPTACSTDPSIDHGDADIYYDSLTKSTKWINKTEHFVVRDETCGAHLIRNALGGKRAGLFAALMSLPPARTRAVRDDITATVVFFNADTTGIDIES